MLSASRSTAALPCPADYHLHTKWSGHATGDMREYVDAALARGLAELGFAIHMPVTIPLDEKLCLSRDEVPLYVAEARRLQRQYAGRISILIGGECDYLPGQEAEIEDVIAMHPFDYIIGSVHFIDGWSFDHPAHKARWETENVARIYRRYYELLAAAAQSGFFDIVGHFDLVKKFGYRPEEDVSDAEAAAADAVAKAGMTVEINSSGFDKPAREQYPSERILRMLHERGVPICFGSDSHAPGEVARHFDRTRHLVRAVGWTSIAHYAARRRTLAPF